MIKSYELLLVEHLSFFAKSSASEYCMPGRSSRVQFPCATPAPVMSQMLPDRDCVEKHCDCDNHRRTALGDQAIRGLTIKMPFMEELKQNIGVRLPAQVRGIHRCRWQL
jgi:hypothetical protein